MNLDIATSVRYPDGEVAGNIEKVVFDPQTGTVHEVILTTPGLLPRMVIVPIGMLMEDEGGVTTFDGDSDAVDALPDYVTESYIDAPEGWEFSQDYAPGAALFPATIYFPMLPEVEESNVPEGTVEISQGTAVLCTDGRYGIVDELVLDDETAQVVALIVRPDDHYAADLEVPFNLVESVDAEAVRLTCTLAELPALGTSRREDTEEPEPREVL